MALLPLHMVRVLILEDDFYQAQDCREQLMEAGAEIVATTGNVSSALATIDSQPVDIALLDINIGGARSFDVARELVERGVPALFLTGYEAPVLPADLSQIPIITKPADWSAVAERLAAVLRV